MGVYFTVAGLALDILGVVVLLVGGGQLVNVIRVSNRPPRPDEARDGDLWLTVAGDVPEEPTGVRAWVRDPRTRGYIGLGLLVSGFGLQIVGAVLP